MAEIEGQRDVEINSPSDYARSPASKTFALVTAKSGSLPRLVVRHYNKEQGLLAGYESETGKRILFRAVFLPFGGMSMQVLHRDTATGEFVHLVEKSKTLDDAGQPVRDISVGGIDMRAFQKSSRNKDKDHADKELKLKTFVEGDTGQAYLDAVPALYAALDLIEQDPETARLIEPIGASAMALQLNAKHFRGFKHADKILGAAKAKELRDNCGNESDCVLRGKRFHIHKFGLFDALSKDFKNSVRKENPSPTIEGGLYGLSASARHSSFLQLTKSATGAAVLGQARNSSCPPPPDEALATCFGVCGGPNCATLGNISTPQCFGHDFCACKYGHTACALSTPENCGAEELIECFTLLEAALSWVGGLWDAFWYAGGAVFQAIISFWGWVFSASDPCEGIYSASAEVPCP